LQSRFRLVQCRMGLVQRGLAGPGLQSRLVQCRMAIKPMFFFPLRSLPRPAAPGIYVKRGCQLPFCVVAQAGG
jgi:hypothetical protein